MNERRLKISLIPMHVVSSWGEELGKKIKEILPDDAIVLRHSDDFERASLAILIYHPNFDVVPDGELVPKTTMGIPLKEQDGKRVILPYNH